MDEPSNILDDFMDYVEQLKSVPFEYATAGLGIALFMIPFQISLVFGMYLGMGLGAAPGILAEDENIMLIGLIVVPTIVVLGLVALQLLVTIPMHASMLRAMEARQERGEDGVLGPAACFSTFKEEAGRALGFAFVHMAIYFFLALFCLLPGLIFLVATDFAWPLVVLDGRRPLDAIQRSAKHFFAHLPWHMGYVLILVSMGFILQYLPFIGAFVAPGLVGGWRLWAYRRVRAELLV